MRTSMEELSQPEILAMDELVKAKLAMVSTTIRAQSRTSAYSFQSL
jgi:hypothetical protein